MTTLEQISAGVWGARTTASIGMGAHLPLRMTVLRDDDDGLLLVSPIAIDDSLAEQLSTLGEVHTLVGPNLLHHRHLAEAQARYPRARLLGAPGLAEKRTDLRFDGQLETGPLTPGVDARLIEGAPKLSEVVVYHRASRTLVLTDAAFNIPGAGGMTWVVLKALAGVLGRFEQSRLIRTLTDDRAATSRSVEAMLAWPLERVVMAHGEVVEGPDVARQLAAGLWWWRGESSRESAAAEHARQG